MYKRQGTDYGMDLYARTSIDQVRYKDGTVLTLDKTMGGIAGGGEKPVSYTHLDVYKRQDIHTYRREI